VSPALYRRLLNAFYVGVKSVDRGNYVVSAGTAPFAEPRKGACRMAAAYFTREFLCVRGRQRPRPFRCPSSPARFDALAHNPYPIGPPRRPAINPDDVVVPDIWKLTRPLRAAIKAGKVSPRRRKPAWADYLTEIDGGHLGDAVGRRQLGGLGRGRGDRVHPEGRGQVARRRHALAPGGHALPRVRRRAPAEAEADLSGLPHGAERPTLEVVPTVPSRSPVRVQTGEHNLAA
jgi:hypothetical protein